jgi:pimeloyl-ACP methyl ester carboxylesterase
MPSISRPDGAELYWEERGDGPVVVVANQFFAPLNVFGRLLDMVAGQHRLVTYDPRGIGSSSAHGPHDLATDAEDLAALIEGTCDGPVVIAAMGDGANRSVHVAADRPDLVQAVVCVSGNPISRVAGEGGEGLAASDSVIDALLAMMETDYRSALRTMIATANPDLDEAAVRERVAASAERCPQEAAAARLRSWVEDEALEPARAAGDRLWILEDGTNPWFLETAKRTAELLPDAHVETVENGAVSRPDIAASYIGTLTGAERAGAAPEGTAPHVSEARGR